MKVFISYSRLDSDLGKAVYNYLCDNHDVFIDTKKIAGGEEWNNVIENEISKCDRFVIILTLSSINRTEVKKEIDLAINKKKMIIPCIHSSIEIKKIPRELNKYHGIQFEEGPELGRKLLAMINVQKEENRNNNEEKNPLTNAYEEKQNVEKMTISSAQVYLERARVFERLRQNQRALSNYDQALKLDPDNFEILFPKVLLLYRIGQFEESLQTIEKAIDLQPEHPEVWYYNGIILEKMERYEEALITLDTDLLVDNEDLKSWNAKAAILLKLERINEAIKAFDEIIRLDPNDIYSWTNKLKLLKKMERNEEALDTIDEILKHNPIDIDMLNNKGFILYKLKRYEEAINCYDKILTFNPNDERIKKIKDITLSSLEKKEIINKEGDANIRIATQIIEKKSNKLEQGIGRCLLAACQEYEEAYSRQEK